MHYGSDEKIYGVQKIGTFFCVGSTLLGRIIVLPLPISVFQVKMNQKANDFFSYFLQIQIEHSRPHKCKEMKNKGKIQNPCQDYPLFFRIFPFGPPYETMKIKVV